MARAKPFVASATLRPATGFAVAFLAMAGAVAQAQAEERYGPFAIAQQPMDTAGSALRMEWRSPDRRYGVAMIDNGVSLRTILTGYDKTGAARCKAQGPLLTYDSADWMELRWRTLIEEQGNFVRTCHVLDRRAARGYRAAFLRDAGSYAAALGRFKAMTRDAFGADRARCLRFRDGADPAKPDRTACTHMSADA